MKAREGKFLSHEEINEFSEKIREEILGAIWFGIIEPVASFTGRSSELKALHDALQRSTGRQEVISQVATISGLGGVGKSELARKYAYKYRKYYGGNRPAENQAIKRRKGGRLKSRLTKRRA
ncbi:hypothetical protein [Wolbachia endosymbiont (group A) of Conops quadrifasciatus]|uniref:hypothetical protein n=1 Tax=Wolbachia endosymbiont (group A) of Conops quadrifasciatus TaxID=3066143 RepID=UPI0031331EE7